VQEDSIHGFRLSPQQRRLWQLQQQLGSSPFEVRGALQILGDLDPEALRAAVRRLIERHEILRTSFVVPDGMSLPLQVVHPPESERTALETELVPLAPGRHRLVLTLPALAADLPSLGFLAGEIARDYTHLVQGRAPGNGNGTEVLQYADVAEWLNQLAEEDEALAERDWWLAQRVAGEGGRLPFERIADPGCFAPRRLAVPLDGETLAALESFLRETGAAWHEVLAASWRALLHRLTGQEDLALGLGCHGRDHEELAGLPGLFARYLPVRGHVDGRETFGELLEAHRRDLAQARRRQDALSGIEADLPFLFEHHELPAGLGSAGTRFLLDEAYACVERFTASLCAVSSGESLTLELGYDCSRLDEQAAGILAEQLLTLLREALADPSAPVGGLACVGPAERALLLGPFGGTVPAGPEPRCVHHLFEEQVERMPDHVALRFQGSEVTYRELNARANRLASHLTTLGVGPDRLVALYLDRSGEMIVALLAALKAGGAYLPIETTYPAERIAFMLEDSGARVLLTQSWLASGLPDHGARVLCLDSWAAGAEEDPDENPAVPVLPSHLAYQIYTSGSTGRPKGCQIEHRSLFNYVRWLNGHLLTDPGVGDFGLFSPLAFDFTVTALYGALLRGKSLFIYPQQEEIGAILAHTFDPSTPIDAIKLTPSHATLLPSLGIARTNVRLILTGGERLAEHHVRLLRSLSEDLVLVNHYGPTEATVGCVSAPVPAEPKPVAIGRPLPGVRVHVVDRELRLVPVGVAGEICVAGQALARGYHDRPELTAERFVPDPFASGERLYRTGDLGRWLADGTLEYLGRIDDQVKIRGYRVELGEIEACLRESPEVADCAVVAREDRVGEPRLVAWVVPAEGASITSRSLREHLAVRLPEWMVPASFATLLELPRTPNGKLDRKALRERAVSGPVVVEPAADALRDPVEEIVAGIWSGLLGVPVGLRDDFFHLGGHSLLATQAVYRIREALGVDLSLEDFFARPTIERLAPSLRAARSAGAEPPETIRRAPRDGDLPLSFAQQRLWFLWRLEGPSPAYTMPITLRVEGSLDAPLLAACLTRLVERHEVLRTVFEESDGRLRQVVRPLAPVAVEVEDLEPLAGPEHRARLETALAEEAARTFDLERGPLLSVRLLREGPASHMLLVTLHHIVADGWSLAVILDELKAWYGAGLEGEIPALEALSVQYADFAVWQREWLSGPVLERQLAWWRDRLAGAPPLLDLPTDRPRPVRQSYRGATVRFRLDEDLTARAREVSRETGTTPFMVFLSAFAALLARWSGQDDLVVGSPIANRNRRDVERLVGFFVNTLALRVREPEEGSFVDLLRQVRATTLGAYAHQDLPFERLVEDLQPQRTLAHAPLFQAMLVYQNVPMGRVELPGLRMEVVERDVEATKFDLHLTLTERDGALWGALDYGADLFDATTVERMAGHLERLLAAATAGPKLPVKEIDLLSPGERHQVVTAWNNTARPYPEDLCIHQLVELQATLRPDAEAVRCRDRALTYGELDRWAGGVAATLRRQGAGRGRFVGLFLDRSVEMAVGVLGALKSGAAYVALDPSHPPERLRGLLEETGAVVLLTHRALVESLPRHGVEVLCVEDAGSEEPPVPAVHPDDLAYGVSTSGSTGRPKIILCRHRGVVSHLAFLHEQHGVGPEDTILQLASLSFDSSVRDLLGPLAAGARVVIAAEPADPAAVSADLGSHAATAVMSVVPSFLEELSAAVLRRGGGRLRLLLVSGEVLHPATCRAAWAAFGPDLKLVNQYGPTEATLTSTFHPVDPEELERRGTLVGRPVHNARVYVLRHGLPAPIGVYGEVFLGGAGLAEGYLGQPESTARAFIKSPLPEIPGERLYRTGDLARWLPDGNLQFLGRADRQVKVRGVRVEPAEVEAALRVVEGVREAAVAARDVGPGGPRLVAWVAGKGGTIPPSAELREHLRSRLPEVLVPSVVVLLESLPRTPNGKVDLQRLPDPASFGERAAVRGTLRSPAEELMAELWSAVLGVEGPGTDDDFFALGGHSLLAVRLASRVGGAFGVELPVRAVFERPRLGELAEHVLALAAGGTVVREPIPRVPRDRELPLSFAQQRLWFLDRLEGPTAAYTVPLALRLRGTLDLPVLAASLARVVERHEALRTVFREVDGRPVQVVLAPAPPALPLVDLTALPADLRQRELETAAREEAAHVFDLAAGPLLRLHLLRSAPDEHVLFATLHHIVTDAWSTGVFQDEVAGGYAALVHRREPSLPPLPVQVPDVAVWQRSWLAGEALAAQEAYWKERLAGVPKLLRLPTDRPRPAVQSFRGDVYAFVLSGLAEPLRLLGRERGATLFMTLTSGFALLLSRWSGQDDVVVGMPVANRSRRETEPLIGLFANTLALRADLSGAPSFERLLAGVREATLGAFAHQDLPFEVLVEALRPERDLSHAPVFQVLFALQNVPGGKVGLPGLTLEPLPRRSRASRFDLSLFVEEAGDGLSARIEYSTDLFDETTIARMAGHLGVLLRAAAAAPGLPAARVPLLTDAERASVLAGLRETARPGPGECVHRLVAAQARRDPSRVAVQHGDQVLTYGELLEQVADLARGLREAGIRPGDRVGVLAERSTDLVAALLGVLAAGAAYLPLDPAFPQERLAFMVRDAGVPLVLTQPGLQDLLRDSGVPALVLDRAGAAASHVVEPDSPTGPEDLAYVLYTSGSTGRPKGVQVHHGALANFLSAMERMFALGPGDTFLSVTTVSFDIAGLELFLPLLAGARVVVADAASVRDGAALAGLVRRSDATILQATPSTWRMLLAAGWTPEPPLRVLCGGEALPLDLARSLTTAGARLWNLYGPTETTIWSTVHEVTEDDLERPSAAGSISIGRPIDNTAVYILDAFLEPVPPGVPGELWIGGDGVARGYLGRPGLTAERFLPDPYSGVPGGRVYRTGDLARWLGNGRIEFLGRADDQVKVRGFRIEPGEIEAALAALPAVRQAVVVARPGAGGDARLVAYVVPAEGAGELDPGEVRRALRSSLPEHMIPAFVIPMAALPLTTNGKLDRRALPDPGPSAGAGEVPFVAPRTPDEERMAGLWRDLLEADGFGVEHGFFDLGGHSLLAVRLVSRIRSAFGVELPVRAVFEHPTVAGLCRELRLLGVAASGDPIRPVPREGLLPLSFAQKRLWFLEQLEGTGPTYNVPAALRLAGLLDLAALQAALDLVVERHEPLRTVFREMDSGPVQVVLPESSAAMQVDDLRSLHGPLREREMERLLEEEIRRPFDLVAGPPLRCRVLRCGDEDHVLVLTLHHIVSDAWSLGVLLEEVARAYRAEVEGVPPGLPPLAVQYADFAVWQNERFAAGVLEPELRFWTSLLADAPQAIELPTDRPRPARKSTRGAVRRLVLEPDLVARLEALGRARGATPFMVLLTGFLSLLSRVSGQEDLVVGTPIANRSREEIEPLIGLFANTLVLPVRLGGDPGFYEALDRTREVSLAAQAHPELPFEKLVEELQPRRDPSRTPLFNVVFAFQNAADRRVELPGVRATPLRRDTGTAKFDLLLTLEPEDEGLRGRFEHDADLFDAVTVERLIGHFHVLLRGAAAAPDTPVTELPLLTTAERHLLLVEANDTWTAFPRGASIPGLFEDQVDRAPDAVAVAEEDGTTLTYAELDLRANRLAHRLGRLGVRPGDRIALSLDRSIELIAALVGILKAGAAYVPLDPAYPADRLGFMLRDAGVRAVISRSGRADRLPDHGLPLLFLDAGGEDLPADRPAVPVGPEDLAYVLYTSGSTGRPKGVGVPHRAVVRLVRDTDYIRLTPEDAVAQASNASFDAATLEIWGALLNGARLVIVPTDTVLSPRTFATQLAEGRITALWLTAGLFNQYSREVPTAFAGLPWLLVGGEALDPGWIRRVLQAGPPRRLLNGYGPTECTTFSATQPVAEVPEGTVAIPIGRPIANAQAHVLDRRLQPQPLGVAGELYVGGDGLAFGYLGRPDLTAERFVPDPFAATPGGRLYRTGDLVRRLADGTLVYLGRVDQQVKIRGFRIELGEIEAALGFLPGVAQAAVVLREDEPGEKRLVAYVVPQDGEGFSSSDLRQRLSEILPEPMVPAAFVPLPALPLTPNGKLDRRALPRPEAASAADRDGRVPPRTPTERLVAGLWSDLLGVAEPGADDDFFELGGHSLLATRLASRLREALAVEIPVRTIFERSLLSELSAWLDEAAPAGDEPLAPVPRGDEASLSFAQQRLWFLERLQGPGATYLVPAGLRLRGELDAAALGLALERIVARHEALRTVFRERDGVPVQVVLPPGPVPLPLVDLQGLPESLRERESARLAGEEARAPFDLAARPPLRARLLRHDHREHVLLVTMHHIVTDGWSMEVFWGELARGYRAAVEGGEAELPALPVQYADFALWQRRLLEGEALEARLPFWRERLAGAPELLQLPTDRPRPAVQSFRGAVERFALESDVIGRLREIGQAREASLFMTLLCAFGVLLARWSGQDDVLVGSPVANRDRRGVEPLIGFFANTLVLRVDLREDPGFLDALDRVREMVLGALAHQDLPFEKLVEELQPERDLSHSPLFQAMLAFENRSAGFELPGLEVAPAGGGTGSAKFDLSLFLEEQAGGRLAGRLEYATDLFDAETVRRMIAAFRILLAGIAASPESPVSRLPLLAPEERRRLLVDCNRTEAGYARDRCIHADVETWADRAPDRPAAFQDGTTLTYGGLDREANRLAHHLRRLGVGPGVLVGLHLPRSLEMLVGLLAILKAGGAWLPLDPSNPPERLASILEDAGAAVVVTRSGLRSGLPDSTAETLCLDDAGERIGGELDTRPEPLAGPEDLAYVLYTSGTTGRPKGVEITHRALRNYVEWANQDYFRAEDRGDFGLFTSLAFDFTVTVVFCALTRGRRLTVYGAEEDVAAILTRALRRGSGVDTLKLTPAHVSLLEHLDRRELGETDLRLVILGGEAVTPRHIEELRSLRGDLEIVNEYGPTEATVGCIVERLEPGCPRILIGRPIANMRAYVLDEGGSPVPAGVVGELCLAGDGLARGYRGRPDLTAERFVSLDLGEGLRERLYRTGDLARFHRDGRLELLGRRDSQVKIRGYRVELEEIEAVLSQHPRVGAAVANALDAPSGGRELVAYLVPTSGTQLDLGELAGFLRQRLPDPMVPSRFLILDALPLAPSGKLDRRRLPPPETLPGADRSHRHVPPRTSREQALARVWTEVLGVEPVGAEDDFFALGGHSILAVRLMSHIHRDLGLHLPLAEIFRNPTLARMAAALGEEEPQGAWNTLVPIRTGGDGEPVVLAPGAGGNPLYFHPLARRLASDRPVYSLQAVGLDGLTDPLETMEEVAAHHVAALRRERPAGPWTFVGHSFGGRVAYEMARQLLREGIDVSRVVVLDAAAPDPRYAPVSAGWDEQRWIAEILRLAGRLGTGAAQEEISSLPPDGGLDGLRRRLEVLGLLPAGGGLLQVRGLLNVFQANHRIRYVPPVAEGPRPQVVLIRAEQGSPDALAEAGLEDLASDPALGWGPYSAGPVEVHVVPGDHLSMLAEPRVGRLAELLAGLLRGRP
jgi:amino acid adenylation domain-containing protein